MSESSRCHITACGRFDSFSSFIARCCISLCHLLFVLYFADDSFADIFGDLFRGVAAVGGGGGILNDVVDFLERGVRKAFPRSNETLDIFQ